VNDDADPNLTRLYRAGAREEPPAWLDRIIVAEAGRDRARAMPRSRRFLPSRWGLPLALAAVVTLSVSLVMVMRDEHAALEPVAVPATPRPQAPSTAASSPESLTAPEASVARESARVAPPHAGSAVERSPNASAERRDQMTTDERAKAMLPEVDVQRQRVDAERSAAMPGVMPQEVTPTPPRAGGLGAPALARSEERSAVEPAPAKMEPAQTAGAVAAREQSTRRPAAPAASDQANVPATVQADKRTAAEGRPDDLSDPEQWLRWIARLRQEGREVEARKNLEEFRQRFPAYPVPDALK
jgi:hypothetical protein